MSVVFPVAKSLQFKRLEGRNMESDAMDGLLYQLEDQQPSVRLETLQNLREIAGQSKKGLPLRNVRRFLNGVRRRMSDSDDQVIEEAYELIRDVIPLLGDSVDQVLSVVVPHLIRSLSPEATETSDPRLKILHDYAYHANDVFGVMDALMNTGLIHENEQVRESAVLTIKSFLTEEVDGKPTFRGECQDLLQSLVALLEDRHAAVVVAAEETLGSLKSVCPDFERQARRLSKRERLVLHDHFEYISQFANTPRDSSTPRSTSTPRDTKTPRQENREKMETIRTPRWSPASTPQQRPVVVGVRQEKLSFGFMPSSLVDTLMGGENIEDHRRLEAAQSLLKCSLDLSDKRHVERMIAHLGELLGCLTNLLDDQNYSIVAVTLELLIVIIKTSGMAMRSHLTAIIPTLLGKFGDVRANVRRTTALAFAALLPCMSNVSLFLSLQSAFEHRNWHVREEAIKTLISGLLQRRDDPIQLKHILPDLAMLICDKNVSVRTAAYELCSILQALDSKQQIDIIFELRKFDLPQDRADLRGLKQRLQHEDLPIISRDGLVEFVYEDTNDIEDGNNGVPVNQKAPVFPSTSAETRKKVMSGPKLDIDENEEVYDISIYETKASTYKDTTEYQSEDNQVAHSGTNADPRFHHVTGMSGPSIDSIPKPDTVKPLTPAESDKVKLWLPERTPRTQQSPDLVPLDGPRESTPSSQGSQYGSLEDTTRPESRGAESPSVDNIANKLTTLKLRKSRRGKRRVASANSSIDGASPSPGGHNSSLTPSEVGLYNLDGERKQEYTSPEKMARPSDRPPARDTMRRSRGEHPKPFLEDKDESSDHKAMSHASERRPRSGRRRNEDYYERSQGEPYQREDSQASLGNSTCTDIRHQTPTPGRTNASSRPSSSYSNYESESVHMTSQYEDAYGCNEYTQRVRPRHSHDQDSEPGMQLSRDYGEDRPIRPMKNIDTPVNYSIDLPLEVHSNPDDRPIRPSKNVDPFAGAYPDDEDIPPTPSTVGSTRKNAVSLATRKRRERKLNEDKAPQMTEHSEHYSPSTQKQMPRHTPSPAEVASPNATSASVVYLEKAELQPCSDPKKAVVAAIRGLQSENWEHNFESLNTLRRLCRHHEDVLSSKASAILPCVLKQVNNLRSSVAKNALLGLEGMFEALQRQMEHALDDVISIVLKRTADTNTFISQAAEQVLNSIVDNVSSSKLINAILPFLASKSNTIRFCGSKALGLTIHKMGHRFSSMKDADRVISRLGDLVSDGSADVRGSIKPVVRHLVHSRVLGLERIKACMTPSAFKRVEQFIHAPEAATPDRSVIDRHSNTCRSSRQRPRASSSTPTTNRESADPPPKKLLKKKRKPARTPDSALGPGVDLDGFRSLESKLENSNWRDRHAGVHELKKFILSVHESKTTTRAFYPVFEALINRTEDSNIKVNILALEVLQEILPQYIAGFELALSSLVPVLTQNMASSNRVISSLGRKCIEHLFEYADPKLLCQPVSDVVRYGNSKIKASMVIKLTGIVPIAYSTKNHCVAKHVIPAAVALLSEMKTDVRHATKGLFQALFDVMGDALFTSSKSITADVESKIMSLVQSHSKKNHTFL